MEFGQYRSHIHSMFVLVLIRQWTTAPVTFDPLRIQLIGLRVGCRRGLYSSYGVRVLSAERKHYSVDFVIYTNPFERNPHA